MDTSPEASSLAQGLRIVRTVVDREKSGKQLLGVSQLAVELDMDQSRVSRLTQELCDLGLLERRDRGPFRTGRGFFGIAATLNSGWVRQAGAELEMLVAATGLRSRVSVRDGFRVILLLASSNDSRAGSFVQPGMVTPVWCTGAGRALLWDHKQQALEGLLSDVNFVGVGGPRAAHSSLEAWDLMVRDRKKGFVAAVEEFEHGIVEVAVPIRDLRGGVLASLSVLGSITEAGSRAAELGDVLRDAAARLSAAGTGE